jgi:eukaryotic-like serine/threonine-protein kinase
MTEETIFLTALEKEGAARAAFLEAACGGDAALRRRVEDLLRSHHDPANFLDVPAVQRLEVGTDEPARTTDFSAAGRKEDAKEGGGAGEPFAFLGPPGGPGSLGRLDHYEVLEEIGRGGMGVVFKARDTRLERIVALKVLAPHLAANATARQRFFREARAAAAVRDEHVVTIHEVSAESGPVPYLVMEFIAGTTLEKRVRGRGALAVREILRIGMQAATGRTWDREPDRRATCRPRSVGR